MREIPLTQGKVALVDDEDYEYLSQFSWQAHKNKNRYTYYARRTERTGDKQYEIRMHREIMNAPHGTEVDHEDMNGLNNQKYNLRITDRNGNQHNRTKYSNNTVGYKGVCLCKGKISSPYRVRIMTNNVRKNLGYYPTPEEAALAYDAAAKKDHKQFARPNFS